MTQELAWALTGLIITIAIIAYRMGKHHGLREGEVKGQVHGVRRLLRALHAEALIAMK